MSTKTARETSLSRLLEEPPPRFVAARKAIAAELKEAGDAALAKELLAQKRPTWTSWALGQLARTEAATVSAVLTARAALATAVAKGEKIAGAQTDYLRALEGAGRAARRMMEQAGHAGAASEARKLREALRELADPEDPTGPARRGETAPMKRVAATKTRAAAVAREREAEKARRDAAQAKARETERRAQKAELLRAETIATRAAERVETLEKELAVAITDRKQADRQVKELRDQLALQR